MQAEAAVGHADQLAKLEAEREAAKKSRAYFSQVASEAQDESYACETEGARLGKVASARAYRMKAGEFAALVLDLSQQIAELHARAAPVVVTAEQAAAQDDTMNFRSVPA